ncbi:hypothetical protein ADEAN_000563900 [Angomonas deanei]|uniref:Uncharacterized protein n=1 Tax=Angomonas deanei TaxID=59799 RepID=A0A7G2CIR9_9TRYP|nr:hypothetical protein ADEAN_000563900 [Angomonas deanei]
MHVYSDAFSFGIIFLELYASFYTTGERLDQLSKWRRGHFDYFYEKTSTDSKSLMEQFPEISLAMGLMAADPLQRLPLHIVRQKLMEQLRECVQEKLTLEKK